MPTLVKVLILEDRPEDAELVLHQLRRAGFAPEWERVETEAEYLARLDPELDLILADYSLPQFDALRALRLLRESGLEIPFIVVAGAIGEEEAVACMRQGAADCLLKDRLARLGMAVSQALEQRRLRAEHRKVEDQLIILARAVAHSPVSIIITDIEGKIEYVNPKFTQVTGYVGEEVRGRNPRLLKSGQTPPETYQQLWETVARGEEWRGELCNLKKSGEPYWVSASIAPIKDTQGQITRYLGMQEDITARKEMEAALQAKEEALREMGQQLWQAAKLATMGELAASIAHELNNPLTTIILRVESLLARIPTGSPEQQSLGIIEQELERMASLVTNLLDFSRCRAAQISSVDVGQEIDTTLELNQYHLRNHRVEVQREFAADLPLVQADRQQLRQVFLNLFTNAVDAMPQGGVLSIRAYPLEQGIAIEIADTGSGITPENLDQVMKPFFTTKPEGKGTGLGLAICRRVVEEHGGKIRLESQVGQGTTVFLTLPVKNGNSAA